MADRDEIIRWYGKNYEIVGHWLLQPGTKVMLGDPVHRRCRFCGGTEPKVTFGKVAHAIPEMLGNKSLESAYECDSCNEAFGQGIENDLGNWSKPLRTLSRIRGKRGVPTLTKDGSGKGWSVKYSKDVGIAVTAYEDDPICEVNEEKKSVTFTLKRDPYTPVGVLKAFMKMGLTLLPEDEVQNFPHLMSWVRSRDYSLAFAESCPIIYQFQKKFPPRPPPNNKCGGKITPPRHAAPADTPYTYFILGYGNEVFQVQLPSQAKDGSASKTLSIFAFPAPGSSDSEKYGPTKAGLLDLTGREIVKSETTKVVMGFEQSSGAAASEPDG